jgi:hypothetical protein
MSEKVMVLSPQIHSWISKAEQHRVETMPTTAVAMPTTTAIEAVQVRIVTTEADKEMIREWVTGTMTEIIKTKIKG